jgi:hypothetical protein
MHLNTWCGLSGGFCNFTMIWDSGRKQMVALAREKTYKRWKRQRGKGRGSEKSRAGMDR